jgi:hypothetical protein
MGVGRVDLTKLESVYRSIPGGAELLDYLCEVPDFHDGEIISLDLHRNGPSHLVIHGFAVNLIERAFDWKNANHAIVTLKLEQVVDLQLDGFSKQNVIGSLMIERVPPPIERVNYLWKKDAAAEDFELTLEPCYGLDGRIRCKGISITFEKRIPADSIYNGAR